MNNHLKLSINTSNEGILIKCIFVYVLLLSLQRSVKYLGGSYTSILTTMILVINYFIAGAVIIVLIKSHKIVSLALCETLAVFFFGVTIIFGKAGNVSLGYYFTQIMLWYIPLSIAIASISEKVQLMKNLYKASLISIAILVITTLLSYNRWLGRYEMAIGYLLAFSGLVVLGYNSIYRRWYNIVAVSIAGIFILFFGSRGPFICFAAYAILTLLSNQMSIKKKALIIVMIVLAYYMVETNFTWLLSNLARISNILGFNSRNVQMMTEGIVISFDSGRSSIRSYYMELVNKSPWIGYGIFGNWIADGTYPHSIIVEFLLSFGYPIGIALLSYIVYLIFSGIRSKDKFNRAIIIVLSSYCAMLFVSSSFLLVWQFFAVVALCLSDIRKFKRQTNII